MAYILSMIANPEEAAIDGDFCNRIAALFPHAQLVELHSRVAYEIEVEESSQDVFLEVQSVCRGRPIDINITPKGRQRKKLLIADMDSTIIGQECIDELADYAGKYAEISAITERAMRGEIDFEGALTERVSMLKGLPVETLESAFNERISLTPGAKTLVATMNAMGAVTALVSGGFTYFTSRIAAQCGFRHQQANELIIEDAVLTGTVGQPILGRAAKQNALLRLASENNMDLADTLAVGDGANDLSMLERSGLGVAFHAKPAVADAAHARIDHGDLTSLLYLQGIPHSEFVIPA